MNVLVIHDSITILAWLVAGQADDAEAYIRNGYPELLADWLAGNLTAKVIEVPVGDEYCADLYEVVGGQIQRRAI